MQGDHLPLTGVSTSRREFLAVAASLTGLGSIPEARASDTDENTTVSQSGMALTQPKKKLIGWGSDVAYPFKVQMNIRKIEELPLDGIVLSNFTGRHDGKDVTFDWECFGQKKFERTQFEDTIRTLKATRFERFTDNFMRYNLQPGDVDWFDDFSAPLQNARMWSEVTEEIGVKGWKFDVEDYKDRTFVYAKQKYAKSKSFEEYARQIRQRGRQMMEAIQSGFPNIVLLLSLAHSYVNRTPRANRKLAELSSYGLLPAFVDGLIEAAGPGVRIIDGQEQAYGYLTNEEYYRGYHDIKQRALELVPPRLWDKYRKRMEAAVAIFANYQLAVPRSEAQGRYWPATYLKPEDRLRLFEQNVYNALNTTDEYVWLYSELMGWWETGHQLPTPEGAVDAITSARRKLAAVEPLGFDLTQVVQQARAKMKAATAKKQ